MGKPAAQREAMLYRALTAVLLCPLFLTTLTRAESAQDRFRGLLDNSPFGATTVPIAAVAPEPDPLEFRAVLEENKSWYFSFFEVRSLRSTWVTLNNPANEIAAKEYNAATMTVSVEYRGKLLTLALKGAKREQQTKAVESMEQIASRLPSDTSVYHDRPFRIGHVAEEMEIRRAMRQESALPTN